MSVSGTYNVTTKTPMGDQTGTMVVNADGDSFSGTLSSPMMGSMDITGGKVSGNTLSWTMDMKVPMPMTLECEATVDGDAISGAIKAGAFGSMALSGTRA
jgi:hypothetical protein